MIRGTTGETGDREAASAATCRWLGQNTITVIEHSFARMQESVNFAVRDLSPHLRVEHWLRLELLQSPRGLPTLSLEVACERLASRLELMLELAP